MWKTMVALCVSSVVALVPTGVMERVLALEQKVEELGSSQDRLGKCTGCCNDFQCKDYYDDPVHVYDKPSCDAGCQYMDDNWPNTGDGMAIRDTHSDCNVVCRGFKSWDCLTFMGVDFNCDYNWSEEYESCLLGCWFYGQ